MSAVTTAGDNVLLTDTHGQLQLKQTIASGSLHVVHCDTQTTLGYSHCDLRISVRTACCHGGKPTATSYPSSLQAALPHSLHAAVHLITFNVVLFTSCIF